MCEMTPHLKRLTRNFSRSRNDFKLSDGAGRYHAMRCLAMQCRVKSPTTSVGGKFTAMRRAVRTLLDARLYRGAIRNHRRVQYTFINVSIDSVILKVPHSWDQ
jgi:hypothetical protein